MVVAHTLSPGAKAMLRERRIGYLEPDGRLYFRWRTWLVNIERPKRVPSRTRAMPLFSGSRENVVHALLMSRGSWIAGQASLYGAFGSLKSSLRLVGGLVPRYLTPASPPEVPQHAGTSASRR